MTPPRETPLQRYHLQRLTECLRDYIKATIPEGVRHRKSTLVVIGDRFKIDDISCNYLAPLKQKSNE